jgi:hypothetical protein
MAWAGRAKAKLNSATHYHMRFYFAGTTSE